MQEIKECYVIVLLSVLKVSILILICASGLREAVLDLASDDHGYILEAVAKFIYLGETDVTVYNVESLLLAADFIKHADLIRYCERFMVENLSLVNFMDYMKHAKTLSFPSLKDACIRLTKEKCSDVLLKGWFLSLSVEEVCEYLKEDELNVTSEDEVLAAVQRWLHCTKASATVKEGYIQSVFPCIRLQFCSRATLESLSRDEEVPMLMKFKIMEFLHHGLHGEGSARKSYSKTQGATVASARGTSGSASAPAIPARRKVPMPAPRPKPDTQEHVLIVGGLKANKEIHKNIVFLDKEGEDSILTEAPLCVHSCSCSVCSTGDGFIVSGGYNRATKHSMSKVQIFSLTSRVWSDLPDMVQPTKKPWSSILG